MRTHELLLKIMAVLAMVSMLCEQLPSVIVDLSLYYCCTAHQALAALCSLCAEGCARTVRSTCVGVRNVIREFIWTATTLLCAQLRTCFFDAHCRYILYVHTCTCTYVPFHVLAHLGQFGCCTGDGMISFH